jgi:C-terminal processing protease CtpA/Prc
VVLAVPEIKQVVLLIDAHAGSAGEIVQLVMAELLLFSVVGDTDIACPRKRFVPVDPA